MSNYDTINALIRSFAGQNNIIGCPRLFCKLTGSLEAGVFLSQIVYYSDKGASEDGWFYKSYREWEEELEISEYKLRKYTRQLEEMGILQTEIRKANGAPTVHYRLDTEKLANLILEFLGIDTEETQGSTTKTTTETTKKHGADAPAPQKSGEELLAEFFGPKLERGIPPPSPPWHKNITEPWAHWGNESATFTEAVRQYGQRGQKVQRLGYELERALGLRPMWSRPKKVKSWAAGLAACLDETGGDVEMVLQAARELREAGLDIYDPWSLVKKCGSLAAKARPDRVVMRV